MLADPPPTGDDKKDISPHDAEVSEALKASREANTALARQLEATNAQLEEANKRRVFTEGDQSQPIRAPQAPVDIEKLKSDLGAQLVSDPGGFALRLMQAAEQTVTQQVEQRTKGLFTGAASSDITNYRREHNDDTDVLAEFDKQVRSPGFAEQLANLPPDQRKMTLDFVYDAAEGRVLRAQKSAGGRRQNPPDLGGGQTISSVGGGNGASSLYKGKPLTSAQKEVLRAASDAGVTDAVRLKKLLDSAAEA